MRRNVSIYEYIIPQPRFQERLTFRLLPKALPSMRPSRWQLDLWLNLPGDIQSYEKKPIVRGLFTKTLLILSAHQSTQTPRTEAFPSFSEASYCRFSPSTSRSSSWLRSITALSTALSFGLVRNLYSHRSSASFTMKRNNLSGAYV